MSTVTTTPRAAHVSDTDAGGAVLERTTCCVVGAGPAGAILALLLARTAAVSTHLRKLGLRAARRRVDAGSIEC
ncbi:MAG TPA: hypothetical protein VE642_07320 [Pyrinomonadaceae bacterium]|jgi:hypothetical protein|nr:hypothetical protein [Pyrinomonadaceae bacterium]